MAGSWDNIDWAATSTATAAWVQALGSIAAVAGAAWIAGRQSREALDREQRERERERAVREEADQVALLSASRLVSIIAIKAAALVEWAEQPESIDKKMGRGTILHLRSARARLERFPIELIRPADAVLLYARALEVGELFISLVEDCAAGRPPRPPVGHLRANMGPLKSFRTELVAVDHQLRDLAEPGWRERAAAPDPAA
jgi:hypothetical protein